MYKLYVENDNDYSDWDIIINVSDIWSKYKKITQEFLLEYKTRINEHKNTIIDTKGVNTWNDLVMILNGIKDINQSSGKLEEVYDWADKNNILIKA